MFAHRSGHDPARPGRSRKPSRRQRPKSQVSAHRRLTETLTAASRPATEPLLPDDVAHQAAAEAGVDNALSESRHPAHGRPGKNCPGRQRGRGNARATGGPHHAAADVAAWRNVPRFEPRPAAGQAAGTPKSVITATAKAPPYCETQIARGKWAGSDSAPFRSPGAAFPHGSGRGSNRIRRVPVRGRIRLPRIQLHQLDLVHTTPGHFRIRHHDVVVGNDAWLITNDSPCREDTPMSIDRPSASRRCKQRGRSSVVQLRFPACRGSPWPTAGAVRPVHPLLAQTRTTAS